MQCRDFRDGVATLNLRGKSALWDADKAFVFSAERAARHGSSLPSIAEGYEVLLFLKQRGLVLGLGVLNALNTVQSHPTRDRHTLKHCQNVLKVSQHHSKHLDISAFALSARRFLFGGGGEDLSYWGLTG